MYKCNLIVVMILLVAGAALAVQTTVETRPNIVWIFSDDHSYQTIGAYGGRLQSLNPSPNIDRLASEGMRFDRCYVGNSICAPSRATLLTGKHSHLNGKYTNGGIIPTNHTPCKKIAGHHTQGLRPLLRSGL